MAKTVSTLSKMARECLYWHLRGETITEAARRAGYAHPEKSGPRLRKSRKFRAAVDEYFHEQEMAANEVVARLSQQAGAGYSKHFRIDDKGELALEVQKMLDDGLGHLIKKVSYTKNDRQTIEFYDAQSALVHLGRYHSLFTERIDHTTDGEMIRPIQFVEVAAPVPVSSGEDD